MKKLNSNAEQNKYNLNLSNHREYPLYPVLYEKI